MSRSFTAGIRVVDKVAMFLLGAINNLPYVVGVASANIIAGSEPTYLGLVLWANTLSGLFARFINTGLAAKSVPYTVNFTINCCAMLGGLLGCAFAPNFWVSLVSVFFIGFSSSFGESVLLCYLAIKRKQALLTFWSSGTGMAGILGAGYSLATALTNVPIIWSFVALTPLVLIYMCCFFCVINKPPPDQRDPKNSPLLASSAESSLSSSNYVSAENNNNKDAPPEVEKVPCFNWKIIKPVWWYMFNCGSVYFLEYVIQSAFVHCAQKPSEVQDWHYPLMNLMYQIGVFISRSSLALFKFPWVGWLTLCQLVFFGMWATQPFFYWMPIYVQIIFMICVGLFGGCSYVNSFHLIMNDPHLSTKEKEVVTSWNAFVISLFIVLSTVFDVVSENTFLKDKVPPKTN